MRARASLRSDNGSRAGKPRLVIVSPAPKRTTLGNAVTAERYARIFKTLGWHVTIRARYEHEEADCLIALHAVKSAASVLSFRKDYPDRQIVLVLTGTDLYRDIRGSKRAARAMQDANAIVTLQPEGLKELGISLRRKATAIVQSASPVRRTKARAGRPFTICVVGHLRYEKDPMRCAYAVRRLPRALHVEVVQAGVILDDRYESTARRESRINARYVFRGALSRAAARRLIAQSDVLVQSSRIEGGANSICEAIASGVPVIASNVSGNIGILGKHYPGLYPVGDTAALSALLERAATSASYYANLQAACVRLQPLVSEQREKQVWEGILGTKGPYIDKDRFKR